MDIVRLNEAATWCCNQFGIPFNFHLSYEDMTELGYYNPQTNQIRIGITGQFKTVRSRDEILETLFHEITHVWQHITEKLISLVNIKIWQQEFVFERTDLDNFEKYFNSPWEVEARTKAKELLQQYNKEIYGQ